MAKSTLSRCVVGIYVLYKFPFNSISNALIPVASFVQFSSWRGYDNENAFAGSCLLRRERMVATEPTLYPIHLCFILFNGPAPVLLFQLQTACLFIRLLKMLNTSASFVC